MVCPQRRMPHFIAFWCIDPKKLCWFIVLLGHLYMLVHGAHGSTREGTIFAPFVDLCCALMIGTTAKLCHSVLKGRVVHLSKSKRSVPFSKFQTWASSIKVPTGCRVIRESTPPPPPPLVWSNLSAAMFQSIILPVDGSHLGLHPCGPLHIHLH